MSFYQTKIFTIDNWHWWCMLYLSTFVVCVVDWTFQVWCILYFTRYLVLSQPVTDKIGQKLNVLTFSWVLIPIHYCVSAKPGHVILFPWNEEMKMVFLFRSHHFVALIWWNVDGKIPSAPTPQSVFLSVGLLLSARGIKCSGTVCCILWPYKNVDNVIAKGCWPVLNTMSPEMIMIMMNLFSRDDIFTKWRVFAWYENFTLNFFIKLSYEGEDKMI